MARNLIMFETETVLSVQNMYSREKNTMRIYIQDPTNNFFVKML